MSEVDLQTLGTIKTLEKKEKDERELYSKLEEYKAVARERDDWKKKYDEIEIAVKDEEIKHLNQLYMARVSQVSPEFLASMNSSKGSRDTHPPIWPPSFRSYVIR